MLYHKVMINMKKIIRFIEIHSLTFFNLVNLLLIPILLMLNYESEMVIINLLLIFSFWHYIKKLLYYKLMVIRYD